MTRHIHDLEPCRDAKTGDVIDCLTAGDSHITLGAGLTCLRCGAIRAVLPPTRKNAMRRLWARVVAKLEDTHRRRTVMANAKANAARGIELVPFQEMPAGWTPPHCGLEFPCC